VLGLAWQAAEHPEWADQITAEVNEIRQRIEEAHGTRIRFIIWAGMGGSMEDKTAYNAAGLFRGGPRFYSLDSTDPQKLKSIVDDMQRRASEPIAKLLPATLVVGMAMGMTSYEPVVNLEKLAKLYDKFGIDSTPNFIYMTLPGSILDQFAGARGYRRIPLQPDNDNTTAGRHSAPLTRGSLYPLALAGQALKPWIDGASLTAAEVKDAFKLAAFLHTSGLNGRDKVTLLLPKSWAAAALWTKQDVEESLGKSEAIGIKIVIGERVAPRHYHRAEDPKQDRVFLAIQHKGEPHPDAIGLDKLRNGKYPVAIVTFPGKAPLSRYMQFIHHVVFGLGVLREMNFVTQPAVELYKSITSEIFKEASEAGGIQSTSAWKGLGSIRHWKGVVGLETPETLAAAILQAASGRDGKGKTIRYGELTFFGDMRYSEEGLQVKAILEEAATRLFRSTFHMVADVYEGPAMNHSYHEMIIGHGGCFSIVVLSEKQARFPVAGYEPDYHMAQFLATRQALLQKGRIVHALLVKDLSPESLEVLEAFFAETARVLKAPVRTEPPPSPRSYAPRSYDRGRPERGRPERGRSAGPGRFPKR
jgi:glucose-6-phosphate isomerase